jgi:hypothetical protein
VVGPTVEANYKGIQGIVEKATQ